MKNHICFILFIAIIAYSLSSFSQASDLFIPVNIKQAYDKGSRSYDGKPGSGYWQNTADYDIRVDFDPKTRLLSGSEKILYYNNSSDELSEIVFMIYPNYYKKGNSRDYNVESSDESDGIIITEMIVNGEKVNPAIIDRALEDAHTSITIALQTPLLPSDKLEFDISWYYTMNKNSHIRTGEVDSSSFFAAYFFPRIAVYDDINGWNDFNYTGAAEFYNDFGSFDVSVTVPRNFIVWATGTLENPKQVLTKKYLDRYQQAFTSDDIVHIVDSTECTQKNITKSNATNTWNFKAEQVTDFAFALSDHYLWDATSMVVDKETNRRVYIDVAYDKHSDFFYQVINIARQAVDFMSFKFPDVPFPFPQMTVFNGLDEMEYPMMVNIRSEEVTNWTIKLTAHEILHSYLPFYMGINETKYAWMDEGFTTFNTFLFLSEMFPYVKEAYNHFDKYRKQAGHAIDAPIFTTSEYLKGPAYAYNSYPKPAGFFLTLKDLLGEDQFKASLQEFMDRWNGKHPTPYDLFFTLNNSSGQNLDWLIKPWFYEFGYLDIALQDVSQSDGLYKITVENKGQFPAPVHLSILFTDGSLETIQNTADVWKEDNDEYIIELKSSKEIKTVELLNPSLLDADLSNNIIHK